MKSAVRYNILTIPGKLRCEIRISIDSGHRVEFTSVSPDGNNNTSVVLFPFISIILTKPPVLNDMGKKVRAPWSPNDSLNMTKYTLPVFLDELNGIMKDMKIPDLYTYHGNRLELNEEIATSVRRQFMVGNTPVELAPVVITKDNDTRVEGIKMKLTNEQSTVQLTLNDMNAISKNLNCQAVDMITFMMYATWIRKPEDTKAKTTSILKDMDLMKTPSESLPTVPSIDDISHIEIPKSDFDTKDILKDDFI